MMQPSASVLSATDLHRAFQTANGVLPVLKGVNLEIHKGEMAAVTGASGVGKSTLLHLLGGLDRPNSGEVRVNEELLTSKNEKELAAFRTKHVGFVFQFHYLLEDFTALENVMVPLILDGNDLDKARSRAEQLMASVGLTDRTSHRPRELSGGEQQRVAVARALANNPTLVLADEPSGNLDTATGRKLHELLFALSREKSISFVIATHNSELAAACDRKFHMADGRIELERG
jgi:lipoprotein-releasing system ATP-binding protein